MLDQLTNYANEILVASILDEMQLDPVLPTYMHFFEQRAKPVATIQSFFIVGNPDQILTSSHR